MPAITSSASASCGTVAARTNEVASIIGNPAAESKSM
jgi:hypothetical protein